MGLSVVITYPEVRGTLWRVYHDLELQRLGIKSLWRGGLPEVHPLYPNHHSPFKKWAQLVSFGMNPWFTNLKDRWTDMYDQEFAFANNQGFNIPNDPRANFVTGEDLTKELPRVEALLSGGMLVEGERNGDWVKIKGLHYDTPVSLDYVKANPKFWVRGVYVGGSGSVFRMLGDKYVGEPFIHPLIVNNNKGVLNIEANKLQRWTSSALPDPLKIYL